MRTQSTAPYDGREVANYLLDLADSKKLTLTQISLLKLIYFCHGWYLFYKERPLVKNEFEAWEKTVNTIVTPTEREEGYTQAKRHFEEKVVRRLCERYPDLKPAIRNVYSSTPLTFRDYLGTPEGEMYGIEKDFNHPMMTTINPKTKIPNLYLTGQNIVFHGILGATIGALVTSFNFVDPKEIVEQINSVKS